MQNTSSSTIPRRQFIQTTGIATAALAASSHRMLAADEKPELIVDCHAHLYSEDESRYPMREDPKRPPEGKGTISHLKREMAQSGVKYVTAIQTSSYYKFDNRFTVDSARSNADFMIAVVTLDPDDPASPSMLERYVAEYNTRGLRSIAAASGRLDDPGVDRLWATAEKLGIVINVQTSRDKRPEIESLVHRHPGLPIVIDHCLNLKIGEHIDDTMTDLLILAKLPDVHAKLTFIPTGSAEPYPFRDLHGACMTLIDAFTPQRCVWGSHFATSRFAPAATYAQSLTLFTEELGLNAATKKAILGETAYRLWFQPQANR